MKQLNLTGHTGSIDSLLYVFKMLAVVQQKLLFYFFAGTGAVGQPFM